MAQYSKIQQVSYPLRQLFLSQMSFWNRFSKIYRSEDPFVRAYDICQDMSNSRKKVAIKDYSSKTQQQRLDVLMNLQNYASIDKIEELCRLVAFCQESGTGDIRAAFQYNDFSLQQLIQKRYWQSNSYQFYQFLFRQLLNAILNFNNIGIYLQELILSNILFQKKGDTYKLKILYDERQKKIDKIQEGIKVFCSPDKVNIAIQQDKEYESINNEEIVFQFGLLLLDIAYLYESSTPGSISKTHSNQLLKGSLTNGALFKSYLIFQNHNSCALHNQLINFKLQYLNSLNSMFLTELTQIISKMIAGVDKRILFSDLNLELKKIQLFRKQQNIIKLEAPFFEFRSKQISPIKPKNQAQKHEDSLKYSPSYSSDHHKKPIISQTTVPTLNGISNSDKGQFEQQKLDFLIIPKQKLLSSKCHDEINKKLQIFIIELQGKVNLTKKQYYDNNIYYGQINPLTQKRTGLGVYVYKQGDIYFGLWRDNSLIDGTYIFKNGDSFEGFVKNGKQGKGKYYYSNGNVYEGQWQDDLKQGLGKMFYSNGDSYEGFWHKGKKNGQGTYFYRTGTIYQGTFLKGKKHGKGIIDFSDGTKVEAMWASNNIEGKGKIFYKNGDYFQGYFNVSLKDGEGQYRWNDSTRYEGCFYHDLMEGEARIRFGQYQYYEGHIVEGKRQGQGLYRYQNGDQFKGIWKNDQKYSGVYLYHSGGSFQGKFKQGQMYFGLMTYPNGQTYEGEFEFGQRNGKGVYKTSSGEIKFDGQWKRDRFIS